MNLYLPDYNDCFFWGDPRSPQIAIDGMEWFVWAGPTNSSRYTGQQNIFNRIDRPLNHYGLADAVVTCPLDQGRSDTLPYRLVEWVGNSYMFNFGGLPPFTTGGLAGQRGSSVMLPSKMALFGDNIIALPAEAKGWHRQHPAGNLTLVDGHSEFFTAVTATNLVW